jgi:hypothetical protein
LHAIPDREITHGALHAVIPKEVESFLAKAGIEASSLAVSMVRSPWASAFRAYLGLASDVLRCLLGSNLLVQSGWILILAQRRVIDLKKRLDPRDPAVVIGLLPREVDQSVV